MRIWTLISGYNDMGLVRACESVRKAWPDEDRAPIVYADGAYEKFPHDNPCSSPEVLEAAHRHASLVVEWPCDAPTEFLKRTSYWAGVEGDYALILDTDESIEAESLDVLIPKLTENHYTLDLRPAKKQSGVVPGNPHRLFKIQRDIHHWGMHVAVFAGGERWRHGAAKHFRGIDIIHHRAHENSERHRLKNAYYQGEVGLQQDEGRFYTLFGT